MKLIFLTVLFAALIGVIQCQVSEIFQVSNFFDEPSAQKLMQQVNDEYWQSATSYRKFADDTLSPEILMREKLRPFYAAMQQYDWKKFQDPQLKRQFEVILRGAKYPPMEYKFKSATRTLKSMSRQKWACPVNETTKCNQAFIPHIKALLVNSNDLENLKYYWKEWRNKMPTEVKGAFREYVRYYQNLSTPELPASGVWYDQYEDPTFIVELEDLMYTIAPFYRELHAHLRHVLRIEYGSDAVPPTGLIPHHLMEQVTYQAWKKDTVLRNPFLQRKLPNIQSGLDGHTSFDLVNISVEYFKSLGFPNINEEFMSEKFIEMEPGSGGSDCKSRIFDYGEIELNYCPKVYYKKLLQTHGDIAQVEYALAKNYMPVGLNQQACPGFGNAMGEAVILSVSNPKHLQNRLGLMKDYDYDDILNLNRLYRLSVHSLLTIPTYFVHEKLWVDIIDGKIGPKEYNCHYWNLMQKYMGVQAPLATDVDAYDMPYKFYEGIVDQTRSTKKLFGEFLGYQIYRAICLNIGEYQRGNAYKVLDNCDFANNTQAGSLLSEMMASGSTKPWREIIKPLTIRQLTRISGTAFLEYYEPLHNWLSDDNVDKNLHVGWMTADNCKGTAYRTPGLAADALDKPY